MKQKTGMKNTLRKYCAPLVFSSALLIVAGCDVSHKGQNQEQEAVKVEAGENIAMVSASNTLTGEQLFAVCQACHNLSEGEPHKVGPNLYGLMGQPAASREGYVYSEALANSDIVWSKGLLLGWMLSAETMVPKTWMVYHNHLSVENTEKLVDYVISKIEE